MDPDTPMLKRRIVQHGPSTLTVSLPSEWARRHDLHRGDEIVLVTTDRGLLITTDKTPRFEQQAIKISGLNEIIPKAIAALYKRGYDDIKVEYERPEELELVHDVLTKSCMGFEIVEESENEVHIRSVSEPSHEEFRALFRRIFYFLLSIAEEGLQAAKVHDRAAYHKLVLRDQNVNKLSDFCRRLVHKHKQREYASEAALYHVIERLEKIGDRYNTINAYLQASRRKVDDRVLAAYASVNALLRSYERVFFDYDLPKMEELLRECTAFLRSREQDRSLKIEDPFVLFQLENVAVEIHGLIGSTIVLNA